MRPIVLDLHGFALVPRRGTRRLHRRRLLRTRRPDRLRQVHGDRRDDVRPVRLGAAVGPQGHGLARTRAVGRPRHRQAGLRGRPASVTWWPANCAAPARQVNQRAASLERLADPRRPRHARRPDLPAGQGPGRRQRGGREAARPEVRGLHPVRGAAPGPVRRLPARQAERPAGHPAAAARRRALPADDDAGEPAGQRGRAARGTYGEELLGYADATPEAERQRGPPRARWPAWASGWRRLCR